MFVSFVRCLCKWCSSKLLLFELASYFITSSFSNSFLAVIDNAEVMCVVVVRCRWFVVLHCAVLSICPLCSWVHCHKQLNWYEFTYTLWDRKKETPYCACMFIKNWPILKILSLARCLVSLQYKDPTTSQACCYTTLSNMSIQNSWCCSHAIALWSCSHILKRIIDKLALSKKTSYRSVCHSACQILQLAFMWIIIHCSLVLKKKTLLKIRLK